MVKQTVTVSSPASIANFGPGFDSFGLCLESPVDEISVKRQGEGSIVVKVQGDYSLPTNPEENTASYSAMRLAEMCGCSEIGFEMVIRKGMKPGSGIGSSAASSAGGAVAMAALIGVKDRHLVLEAAAMGEELVTGSRHFDNVAAAIYGGFTVVSDLKTRTVIRVRPPSFNIIVAIPKIEIETRNARKILPESVKIGDAVSNVGWASGMLHAMMKKDVDSIGRYLEDKLAAPYRKALIPGYDRVHKAAMEAGASGVSIGGSGPAVFAVSVSRAAGIKKAMVQAFSDEGLESESFITVPGSGARVIKSK